MTGVQTCALPIYNNLIYRSGTMALMLSGCVGVNGGGMNHYVGQEKLAPMDSWAAIMSGKDWQPAVRLQQAPIWHYINSSQWRYDGNQADYNTVPENELSTQHSADLIVKAVRNGWMPFYPQYNKSNQDIIQDAKEAGATTDDDIKDHLIGKLKSKEILHSVADPDDEVNFPRVWYIWRGNAIMSSAKGHEYFLKHYLGTHHNDIADESAKESVHDINWKEDEEAINAILHLSTLTNGILSDRAYAGAEKRTGLKLRDIGEGSKDVKLDYKDLQAQPRRYNNSPLWSGLMNDKRAYSAFTYNVERLVPWRTLTGRQHFYLDHEGYIKFGEHLPTYKPSPKPEVYGELKNSVATGKAKVLNVLTPHGKWHIHSTYGDTLRMLTLSRGIEPCWLSEEDAEELGIKDNDWVEVFNDNGVYCTRACVSARIPKGVCMVYHSPERTYSVPKSEVRGNRRAGGHNSFTRVHIKPNLLMGGYGQFTYHFNYWGPVGVNRDTHVLVQKMDKVRF